MTMSGKVVREITGDELGPLHMGKNITRFKWNGTDEFGSKLANGVYLYTIRTSDKDFEINNKFASDNFGKIPYRMGSISSSSKPANCGHAATLHDAALRQALVPDS